MEIHERWSFAFVLKTTRRDYVLYAPSADERSLWVHTFRWIIWRNEFLNVKEEEEE